MKKITAKFNGSIFVLSKFWKIDFPNFFVCLSILGTYFLVGIGCGKYTFITLPANILISLYLCHKTCLTSKLDIYKAEDFKDEN